MSQPRLRFDHLHKPFYNSRAWKLARAAYLRRHPICETCTRVPSTEVHHKVSLEDIAARRIPEWVIRLGIDLRLDDRNFKAQCKPCHSRETVRQDGGFGRSPQPHARKENRLDSSIAGSIRFEPTERIAVWEYATGHRCLASIIEAEPWRARVQITRGERTREEWTTYDKLTRRSDGAQVSYAMLLEGPLALRPAGKGRATSLDKDRAK